MHIIVLENQPSSQRGGQELILLDVCRGLAARGHEISLLYLEEGNLIKQYQEFCSHLIKINSFLLDRSTIKHSLKFFNDIWKVPICRNTVVYSNRYHDVVFGYLLSLIKQVPFVCYLQLPPHTKSFGRPHTLGLKGVNKFIALSQQTKLDWLDTGLQEEKIDIVHVGINRETYQPSENFSATRQQWSIPEDTRVISYVGRLDTEKGIEILIKAFALLVKSGVKSKLLIAGKPVAHASIEAGEEYQQSLEQLSIDLGVASDVKFLGHVTNTTAVYQVSDVTVVPSLWSEPFGRVIIESMACGTPVVASRTGGIPEILTAEFQKELFQPGNEQALLETLSQIIDWRDRDPAFGKRCRQHILSNFSLDNMINGIEKSLLSVAN
ncbi:glycosyltransferase family 4 protein [Chroogloeocystis siderophila]|jgi:glycosyltransferase involved in cell wall biosynthesis|uniref:Glycosyl transferase family 1 n=1 Tax=Chroogloeocystis siderophila 5.2 s.c.1 TaxID=247279 RepID=A0A1U7HQH8_9CHRO|nr:glycosyltransferase family 4 protein [Chroogloeocystis siderophila]OKH25860.1 glycosyl transferase family 1 [Chroogloeocystis siderophila 5.2 s.c.1]